MTLAHIGEDGKYPSDFNIPKTVETIRLLDSESFEPFLILICWMSLSDIPTIRLAT